MKTTRLFLFSSRCFINGLSLFLAVLALELALSGGVSRASEPETGFNAAPLSEPQSVEQLRSFLTSDKPAEEKVYALKQAARFASDESVSVIADYLSDERLSQAARLALLQIPGESARKALCAAAEKMTDESLLPGTLRTIGQRREPASAAVLASFLSHARRSVVQAAAEALGEIGAAPALEALLTGWKSLSAADKPEAAEREARKNILAAALLACDRAMRLAGPATDSETIYRLIYEDKQVDSRLRVQALVGLIGVSSDQQAQQMIWQAFDSPDKAMQGAFYQMMNRLDENQMVKRLTEQYSQYSEEKKLQVLAIIKGRKLMAARDFVFQLCVTPGEVPLRNAALDAFSALGDVSYMKELFRSADAAQKGDWSVVVAHLGCMQKIPDPKFDDLVVEMLGRNEGPHRSYMLFLAAERKIAAARPFFLKDICSNNIWERRASVRGFIETSSVEDLPLLFDLYPDKSADVQQSISEAVREIARLEIDSENAGRILVEKMPRYADSRQRAIWLAALAATGSRVALDFFAQRWPEADETVQSQILEALGAWRDESAADLLIQAAKSSANEKLQTRAVRGLLRIVRQMDVDPNRRFQWAKAIEPTIRQDAEKLLFVEALGRLGTQGAFQTVLTYRANSACADAANEALFAISKKLDYRNPEVFNVLKDIEKTTSNGELKQNISDLLKGIVVSR